MSCFKCIAIALVLLFSVTGAAKRKVREPALIEASTNATSVRVGDAFQLDVEVRVFTTDDPRNLNMPKLDGFKLIRQERGPVRKQTNIVGGVATYEKSYSFHLMLEAIEPGIKEIGAIRVLVGSYQAVSRPLAIRVFAKDEPAGESGRSSALAPTVRFKGKGKEPPAYFLDVRFDKDEAWVGEQVALTMEVFATDYIELDGRGIQPPKPPGFWVEDLVRESRVRPTERVVAGKRYYVYRFWRLALFPLDAGDRELTPENLSIQVTGDGWRRRRTVALRSEPVVLYVKPLPNKGRPPDFQPSNVGDYQLRASVEPRKTTVGEPVTLTVEASGFGNVGALDLPTVSIPAARVFPPTTSERKSVDNGRLFGVKGLEVLVQPTREGRLVIPPFELAYFEPAKGQYKKARTREIVVPVGPARARTDNGGPNVIAKSARPVRRNLQPGDLQTPLYARPLYALALGLIATLAGGVVVVLGALGRRSRSSDQRRRKSARVRRERLVFAREERDLTAAEAVLREATAARCGEECTHLEADLVADRVRERDPVLGRDLADWLQGAAASRFGRAGKSRGLFDDAQSLLSRLEDLL